MIVVEGGGILLDEGFSMIFSDMILSYLGAETLSTFLGGTTSTIETWGGGPLRVVVLWTTSLGCP